MTTVSDPISSLASTNAASAGLGARNRLDQTAFLRLMITQFRNQDPTKPKDPSEFLGQLAQFSTVSGIQDMQGSIGDLSSALRSQNILGGAVLVGRDVLAPGSSLNLAAGQTVSGSLDVPAGAASVDVEIKDSVGQLIRRMTVTPQSGLTEFSWDGLTERGVAAGAGHYSISATARVGTGTESVPAYINTHVQSVTIDPTTQGLVLNTRELGAISLGDVRRVM